MDEISGNRFRNRRMKLPKDLRTAGRISIVAEAPEKD
jgi:hypothetical protein